MADQRLSQAPAENFRVSIQARDSALAGSGQVYPSVLFLPRWARRLFPTIGLALHLGGAIPFVLAADAPEKNDAQDGEWVRAPKDYANTRFSQLDQIKADNAKDLRVAWTFSTGVDRGQEAAPIIVGDTMYVVTPFPNYVYALDVGKQGALKWKYDPQPEPAAQGVACCDVVNRGACYADGQIVYATLDCNVVALDAHDGQQKWKVKIGEINNGETITMAPLIVKDKVYVGNSGGEFGVRGWLKALDLKDGHTVWTAYSTGPDKDVLIGSDFKPHYESDKGQDLGVKSWPPEQWKIGGGTVWGWISYDPETNLLFYGTGNPGIWNPEQRPGDNKWTCGIFARDADSGQAKWFYQFSPHDLFDYDSVNENVLLELPIGGQSRKVVIHPERNGYMYVLDRGTGEVLNATAFARVTWAKGVDLKSGRPIENEEKRPGTGKTVRDVAPASPGAKDWQPTAYSPRTHLLYVPHQNLAMDYEGTEASYIAGTPYVGVNVKMYGDAGNDHRGEMLAWDPVGAKKAWDVPEKFPVWSGALVTAGDVVFYGTMEGWFKAVNAKTGELLWKFKCGSGIIGQPVTYRGPDGKQYVAILSGVGGWSGAIVSGELDARDPTAGGGFVNAMSDLPQATTKGGTLYVFALP